MSHIPNSAMPHAGGNQNETSQQGQQSEGGLMSGLSERANGLMEMARENPKTAIAAGAAVIGAVAAAAIPLVRGRGSSEEEASQGGSSGKSGKSGSSK